jgi:hypothetical protein
MNNNVAEGKKERCKVKFPCKICTNAHLTHLCPKLVEDARLLSLSLAVLTNPFPHKHHMASSSSNVINVTGGGQNPLAQDYDYVCIHMVNSQVNVATRSCYYSSPQNVPGLESPPPLEMPLQREKQDTSPHILK